MVFQFQDLFDSSEISLGNGVAKDGKRLDTLGESAVGMTEHRLRHLGQFSSE
jgi:hypothetical protein